MTNKIIIKIYPTLSQNTSVRMYHQGPPNYSQMQTQPQMMPPQGYAYPQGMCLIQF